MTFGQKLRELREAKKMSREALAVGSNVSFGTINAYEADRRSPSLAIAQRLAKCLGVTCEAFSDCEDITSEKEQPTSKKKGGKKK